MTTPRRFAFIGTLALSVLFARETHAAETAPAYEPILLASKLGEMCSQCVRCLKNNLQFRACP